MKDANAQIGIAIFSKYKINAPRGREIFEKFSEKFTDNVPEEVTTTLDQNIHRVKGLQLVVDGFFSSKNILVQDVKVCDGVSDHKTVLGSIEL